MVIAVFCVLLAVVIFGILMDVAVSTAIVAAMDVIVPGTEVLVVFIAGVNAVTPAVVDVVVDAFVVVPVVGGIVVPFVVVVVVLVVASSTRVQDGFTCLQTVTTDKTTRHDAE